MLPKLTVISSIDTLLLEVVLEGFQASSSRLQLNAFLTSR